MRPVDSIFALLGAPDDGVPLEPLFNVADEEPYPPQSLPESLSSPQRELLLWLMFL